MEQKGQEGMEKGGWDVGRDARRKGGRLVADTMARPTSSLIAGGLALSS